MTRGGHATEWLWMNYTEPAKLHDYRYLGDDYREREKIRRQQRRWTARLARMDRLQRLALMAAIAGARIDGNGEAGSRLPELPAETAMEAHTAVSGEVGRPRRKQR